MYTTIKNIILLNDLSNNLVWKPELTDAEKTSLVRLHRERKRLERSQSPRNIPPPPRPIPTNISQETRDCLQKIHQQGLQDKLYTILEVNGMPYCVTKNDLLVTKRLVGTKIGDLLTLTNVREIGSKDYYIRGQPLVDPQYFRCQAVVLEQPWSAKYTKYLRRVGQGPGDRKWRKRSYRDRLNILRITDISVTQ